MKILGNDITYSIGMILFVLSIIRFAAFVKIFSFWYIFTSERSRRIYNLLNDNYFLNKINWGFSFRVTNKYYNLMCLIPIFMILIYLYALVFKTFEDFDTDGVYTRFNNISNCIWFILVTMTTIGYGEYTPVTMVGRMIIVTCCIVGVFMISLIFSSFVVLTDLENSEQNAFDQIEYFYMKDRNKDEYQKYLNELIKYKLNKKKKSPGIENLIERFKLDMKRKGIINRKLKKDYSENKVLEDFGIAICKSWERVDEYLINFSKLSPDLLSECEHMKNDGPLLRDQLKSSQKLSFQIFNLAKFNNTCGSLFEIKDLDLINSKSMIQSERLYKALKSFIKVYGSKKVNPALKENGNSDKFDEFFDLENLKNIFNKLPMSPVKHTNTPSDNYFHIKSSIILNNNQTSGNNDNHNTSLTVSKADDLNHINSLDVIDEEISEFDN